MKSKHTLSLSLPGIFRFVLSFSMLWMMCTIQPGADCDSAAKAGDNGDTRFSYTIDQPLQQQSNRTSSECDGSGIPSNPVCDLQPVPAEECLFQDIGVLLTEQNKPVPPSKNGQILPPDTVINTKLNSFLDYQTKERFTKLVFLHTRSLRAPPVA